MNGNGGGLARSLALFSLSLLLARSPSSAHGAHLRGESLPACCWKRAKRVCTMRGRAGSGRPLWQEGPRRRNIYERILCMCKERLHSATSGRSGQKCWQSGAGWMWSSDPALTAACGCWICVWRRGARRHFMIKSFCEIAERAAMFALDCSSSLVALTRAVIN